MRRDATIQKWISVCALVLAASALPGATLQVPVVAPPAQTQAAPATDPPQPPFGEWLAALKAEAIARGISVKTVDAVLTDVEPLAVVVARDRTQAELTLTFDRYLKRRLTKTFVETGRKMVRQNAALLRQVAAKYGVSPGTVVAIWGMESNYGRFSGT